MGVLRRARRSAAVIAVKRRQVGGNIAAQRAQSFANRVTADGGVVEAQTCLEDRIQTLMDRGMWDKASAVWIPHGVKANKLYAAKGGAGADLGFTRAGTRTRKAAAYLETVATGVPALDYTNDTCPALSLEPARTNLLLQSEAFDNASWTKTGATVTANAIAGPDNLSTADAIFETATTGAHYIFQTITKAASSLPYTLSAYIKPNGRDWTVLQVASGINAIAKYFNITTGTLGSTLVSGTGFALTDATIKLMANGFYRVTMSFTSDATTSAESRVLAASADLTASYAGDITKGLYLYGAQLEQASYATSYISTTTATVSGVADAVPAKTAFQDYIGQTEGTLYWEGYSFADNTHKHISINDGTTANRVVLGFSDVNTFVFAVIVGNSQEANINGTITVVSGTKYKAVLTYKANKFTLTVNGVKDAEDLSGTVPACHTVKWNTGNNTNNFYGGTEVLLLSKTAISDSEAIALTQP